MASECEATSSTSSDPNLAVVWSFLEVFGEKCALEPISISQLVHMIEDTQEVAAPLRDLHVKLLRRAVKSFSAERWEKCLTKFCHQLGNHQEGWELERFGYKKASWQVKLSVLKKLLEYQFTCNSKFKTAVNQISSDELRLSPVGRDKKGRCYWLHVDHRGNLRLYREDHDEETWFLIASDRDGLATVIQQLKSGESPTHSIAEPILNEDSNSVEDIVTKDSTIESEAKKDENSKPADKTEEEENSSTAVEEDHSDNEETNTCEDSQTDKGPSDKNCLETESNDRIARKNEETVMDQSTDKVDNVKNVEIIDVKENDELKNFPDNKNEDIHQSKNKEIENVIEPSKEINFDVDNLTAESISNKTKEVDEASSTINSSNIDDKDTISTVAETSEIKNEKVIEDLEDKQEKNDLNKKTDVTIEKIDEKDDSTECNETPLEESKENANSVTPESNDPSVCAKDSVLDNETGLNNTTSSNKREREDESSCIPNLEDSPKNLVKKCKKDSEEVTDKVPEDNEVIEEKVMIITGEGSGAECEGGVCFSEEITEDVMYVYGEGWGAECCTGNPSLGESEDNSSVTTNGEEQGQSPAPLPVTKRFLHKSQSDTESSSTTKLWSVDSLCSKPSTSESHKDDTSSDQPAPDAAVLQENLVSNEKHVKSVNNSNTSFDTLSDASQVSDKMLNIKDKESIPLNLTTCSSESDANYNCKNEHLNSAHKKQVDINDSPNDGKKSNNVSELESNKDDQKNCEPKNKLADIDKNVESSNNLNSKENSNEMVKKNISDHLNMKSDEISDKSDILECDKNGEIISEKCVSKESNVENIKGEDDKSINASTNNESSVSEKFEIDSKKKKSVSRERIPEDKATDIKALQPASSESKEKANSTKKKSKSPYTQTTKAKIKKLGKEDSLSSNMPAARESKVGKHKAIEDINVDESITSEDISDSNAPEVHVKKPKLSSINVEEDPLLISANDKNEECDVVSPSANLNRKSLLGQKKIKDLAKAIDAISSRIKSDKAVKEKLADTNDLPKTTPEIKSKNIKLKKTSPKVHKIGKVTIKPIKPPVPNKSKQQPVKNKEAGKKLIVSKATKSPYVNQSESESDEPLTTKRNKRTEPLKAKQDPLKVTKKTKASITPNKKKTQNTSPKKVQTVVKEKNEKLNTKNTRKRGHQENESLSEEDYIETQPSKKLKTKPKSTSTVLRRKKVEERKQLEESSSDEENQTPLKKGKNNKITKTPSSKEKKSSSGSGKHKKVVKKKPESKTLVESDIDDVPIILKSNQPKLDDDTPVRQSRRIAQLKIREEAQRRLMEEVALRELKAKHKKNKSKDADWKGSESEHSSDGPLVKSKSKKSIKKKSKSGKKGGWRSSNSDSSDDSEIDDDIEDREPEEDILVEKSDHEFSPESDVEGETAPVRRARTKKEGGSSAANEDCVSCKGSDHPEWILLCDACDMGWHASCLKPMLFSIPEGDWFCPPCSQIKLVDALTKKLQEYDEKLKIIEKEDLERKDREDKEALEKPVSEEVKSEQSESDSSDGSSDDDEDTSDSGKIYRLRERRQLPISYHFKEYDQLISSALKEEYKEVDNSGAGNQGRGKDISTIINADKEEKKALLEATLMDEEKNEDEKKEAAAAIEESVRRVSLKSRKKPRKLNSLEVMSDDADDNSDEDFKETGWSTSSSDDSDSESDKSKSSHSSDSLPIRRSQRSGTKKVKKRIIDSPDRSKKKSKRLFDEESSSEASDEKDWVTTNKKKKKVSSSRRSTFRPKEKSPRKKKKRPKRSDGEDEKHPRAKVRYGGLSDSSAESHDWSPAHRTRQKKVNYTEMPNTESEDEMHKPSGKHMDSSDEYKVDTDSDSDSSNRKNKNKGKDSDTEEVSILKAFMETPLNKLEGGNLSSSPVRVTTPIKMENMNPVVKLSAISPIKMSTPNKEPEKKEESEEVTPTLTSPGDLSGDQGIKGAVRGRGGRGRGSRGSYRPRGSSPRGRGGRGGIAHLVGGGIVSPNDGESLEKSGDEFMDPEREKKRKEKEAKLLEKEKKKEERLKKKEEKIQLKEQRAKEREEKKLAKIQDKEQKKINKQVKPDNMSSPMNINRPLQFPSVVGPHGPQNMMRPGGPMMRPPYMGQHFPRAQIDHGGELRPRGMLSGDYRQPHNVDSRMPVPGERMSMMPGNIRIAGDQKNHNDPRMQLHNHPRLPFPGEPKMPLSGEPRMPFSGNPRMPLSGESRMPVPCSDPRLSISGDLRMPIPNEQRQMASGEIRLANSPRMSNPGDLRMPMIDPRMPGNPNMHIMPDPRMPSNVDSKQSMISPYVDKPLAPGYMLDSRGLPVPGGMDLGMPRLTPPKRRGRGPGKKTLARQAAAAMTDGTVPSTNPSMTEGTLAIAGAPQPFRPAVEEPSIITRMPHMMPPPYRGGYGGPNVMYGGPRGPHMYRSPHPMDPSPSGGGPILVGSPQPFYQSRYMSPQESKEENKPSDGQMSQEIKSEPGTVQIKKSLSPESSPAHEESAEEDSKHSTSTPSTSPPPAKAHPQMKVTEGKGERARGRIALTAAARYPQGPYAPQYNPYPPYPPPHDMHYQHHGPPHHQGLGPHQRPPYPQYPPPHGMPSHHGGPPPNTPHNSHGPPQSHHPHGPPPPLHHSSPTPSSPHNIHPHVPPPNQSPHGLHSHSPHGPPPPHSPHGPPPSHIASTHSPHGLPPTHPPHGAPAIHNPHGRAPYGPPHYPPAAYNPHHPTYRSPYGIPPHHQGPIPPPNSVPLHKPSPMSDSQNSKDSVQHSPAKESSTEDDPSKDKSEKEKEPSSPQNGDESSKGMPTKHEDLAQATSADPPTVVVKVEPSTVPIKVEHPLEHSPIQKSITQLSHPPASNYPQSPIRHTTPSPHPPTSPSPHPRPPSAHHPPVPHHMPLPAHHPPPPSHHMMPHHSPYHPPGPPPPIVPPQPQIMDPAPPNRQTEEESGEFGGLVSYFSSQREDDMDS